MTQYRINSPDPLTEYLQSRTGPLRGLFERGFSLRIEQERDVRSRMHVVYFFVMKPETDFYIQHSLQVDSFLLPDSEREFLDLVDEACAQLMRELPRQWAEYQYRSPRSHREFFGFDRSYEEDRTEFVEVTRIGDNVRRYEPVRRASVNVVARGMDDLADALRMVAIPAEPAARAFASLGDSIDPNLKKLEPPAPPPPPEPPKGVRGIRHSLAVKTEVEISFRPSRRVKRSQE